MSWESLRTIAAIVSALCAIVAAWVSVTLFNKARSGDWTKTIADGDKAIKEHTDKHLQQMREANTAAIAEVRSTVAGIDERTDQIADAVARIEAKQQADDEHNVRHRDLGLIHGRINEVNQRVASVDERSQLTLNAVRSIESYLRENK